MIIRIVKLHFQADKVEEFLKIFEASKQKIRAFEGCQRLELLQEAENPSCFMTYSWWNSTADLEMYRHSELFKSTWAKTKVLFSDRPLAWSMNQIEKLA